MRTPALAMAWGIWTAHRWGFVACMATLMALAATYPLVFSQTREPAVVILSILPLLGVFAYVLNALLFSGEPGSLVAGYPRAMLVLPVRTRTLVFWPMLYGSLGVVLLWLFTAVLVYGPSGDSAPLLLPCLALAALMAWIHALAWLPIPNYLLRLLVILVAVLALGFLPYWLMVSEGVSARRSRACCSGTSHRRLCWLCWRSKASGVGRPGASREGSRGAVAWPDRRRDWARIDPFARPMGHNSGTSGIVTAGCSRASPVSFLSCTPGSGCPLPVARTRSNCRFFSEPSLACRSHSPLRWEAAWAGCGRRG